MRGSVTKGTAGSHSSATRLPVEVALKSEDEAAIKSVHEVVPKSTDEAATKSINGTARKDIDEVVPKSINEASPAQDKRGERKQLEKSSATKVDRQRNIVAHSQPNQYPCQLCNIVGLICSALTQ